MYFHSSKAIQVRSDRLGRGQAAFKGSFRRRFPSLSFTTLLHCCAVWTWDWHFWWGFSRVRHSFSSGVINFQGFKCGQAIVLKPRLKGSIRDWWNIIWTNWHDVSHWGNELRIDFLLDSVKEVKLQLRDLNPSEMSITHFSLKCWMFTQCCSFLYLTNNSSRKKSQHMATTINILLLSVSHCVRTTVTHH